MGDPDKRGRPLSKYSGSRGEQQASAIAFSTLFHSNNEPFTDLTVNKQGLFKRLGYGELSVDVVV